MSVNNRLLVKDCIDSINPDLDKVSRLFYRELFHLDIRMEEVFPGNVVFLNRKFSNMMGTFRNVKHLEKISDSVEKMGERHALNYAVEVEFFPLLEQALLTALREHLKDTFDAALEQAWREVFGEVAALMQKAMAQVDRSQAKPRRYDEKAYDPELLADVGGIEVVMRIHRRFYDVMFDHPWLGQFFYGKDQDVLVLKQTQFMVAAFGGPNDYRGDTPAFVHMHMFITEEQADLREQILRQAIAGEGLSADIAERWLKIDHAFRPGIVKKSVDECVLKCLGQVPVMAKKPAGGVVGS